MFGSLMMTCAEERRKDVGTQTMIDRERESEDDMETGKGKRRNQPTDTDG